MGEGVTRPAAAPTPPSGSMAPAARSLTACPDSCNLVTGGRGKCTSTCCQKCRCRPRGRVPASRAWADVLPAREEQAWHAHSVPHRQHPDASGKLRTAVYAVVLVPCDMHGDHASNCKIALPRYHVGMHAQCFSVYQRTPMPREHACTAHMQIHILCFYVASLA